MDLDYREFKGIGREKVSELLWRDEVSRLTTRNNELNLILTEDSLSIELSKVLQNEIKGVKARNQKQIRPCQIYP